MKKESEEHSVQSVLKVPLVGRVKEVFKAPWVQRVPRENLQRRENQVHRVFQESQERQERLVSADQWGHKVCQDSQGHKAQVACLDLRVIADQWV